MRMNYKKFMSIVLTLVLMLTLLPIQTVSAETGDTNVEVGETSNHESGDASDKDAGYYEKPMGIRVSIYWAPAVEGATDYPTLAANFVDNPKSVQQIGKTVDIVRGIEPNYGILFYSSKSVYDYMQDGDKTTYKATLNSKKPYSYIGTNTNTKLKNFNNQTYGDFVASMPNLLDNATTAADWETWFTGSADINKKTYEGISKLTEMCGQYISPEDIEAGILSLQNGKQEGVYKVFFEPMISVKFKDRKGTYWTLRDAIKYGLADKTTNSGRNLDWQVSTFGKMFEYIGNKAYLQDPEPCLNMVANETDYQINLSTQGHDAIVKALSKGGKAYNSLGVGCVSPQRDIMESGGTRDIKVVKSYVIAVPQNDGTNKYETYAPSTVEYLSKAGVESLIEIAQTPITVNGDEDAVGFVDSIISTNKDITKDTDITQITWEKGLAKNGVIDEEITAKFVKALNVERFNKMTYCLKNNILVKEAKLASATENFANYKDSYSATYTVKLGQITKTQESEMTTKYYDAVKMLSLEASNEAFKSLQSNKELAKGFYEFVGIRGDLDYMLDNAKYIEEPEDIVLGGAKPYTVYIRYLVMSLPRQITLVEKYVDGVYKETVEVAKDTNALSMQVIGDNGTINYYISTIRDIEELASGYSNAEFQGWGIATGYQTTKPAKYAESGKTDTVNKLLNPNENLYVIYKVDKSTITSAEITVPQWRLSENNDKSLVGSDATAKLTLKSSNGCYAFNESLTPSGKYNYVLFNSNGKETLMKNIPSNMYFTNYLHSKAKATGSSEISLSNPEATVEITGFVNAIKSTSISGIKLASWPKSNALSGYDIAEGTTSKITSKSVNKKSKLEYAIKNKDAFTHVYGVYNHSIGYYSSSYIDKKTGKTITVNYSYPICNCITQSETPGTDYTNAIYNLDITFDLYKATNNDKSALKVKTAKTEENGKTSISMQNKEYLTIYPEVPMLFQDDSGEESIVFAAGSVGRQISLIDYHELEYITYVSPKVDPSAVATDSKAKTKAKSIGLGSLPVALKGSNLSVSFDIKKSQNSNEQGTLTVKSYALDVDNASLKTAWGNEEYNSKSAHTSLLNSFSNFSNGVATEQLDIAVPNGSNSAYTGPKVTNKLSYKQKDTNTVKHTLTVRGGVLTEVDGKSLVSIKANDKDLYKALDGMKLVGSKADTVLKTLVSGEGDNLTESTFATLANKERGVTDIKTGDGWYFEDSTTLVVMEYTTTYTLPIAVFPDKIPMTVGKYLKTPIDKNKFYSEMSKGYNVINYTMTSSDVSGLGKVKVYFEHNSRTDNTYGSQEPAYGISNVSTMDTTAGGF